MLSRPTLLDLQNLARTAAEQALSGDKEEALMALHATMIRADPTAADIRAFLGLNRARTDLTRDEISMLVRAVAIATIAHAGQTDKAGVAYIEHPRRVANRCQTVAQVIVAWIHDTLEDSQWAREGVNYDEVFPAFMVAAVRSLTHLHDEPLETYYARLKADQLALDVKANDLADNCDPERLEQLPVVTQRGLRKKYTRAHLALGLTLPPTLTWDRPTYVAKLKQEQRAVTPPTALQRLVALVEAANQPELAAGSADAEMNLLTAAAASTLTVDDLQSIVDLARAASLSVIAQASGRLTDAARLALGDVSDHEPLS